VLQRIFKIKAIIALVLVLCFGMPFLLSATSAASVAEHTHICSDEEHKDVCTDVKECCTICLNYYNAKARMMGLYGNTANKVTEQAEQSLLYSVLKNAFSDTVFLTLVSLNVRLNN
jgi:hypothetical protein